MHYLSDVVHVNLYMFGPLPGNWICGYLNSTLVFTKEDSGQSTTKIKLRKNALQPNSLDASIHRSLVLGLY